MTIEKVGAILGIIVSLLAIWEGVARITGHDGPIAVAQDVGGNSATTELSPPPITTEVKDLDKPSGVSLSGDCDNGFTLTWQPVDGADSYRIEQDGHFVGTEQDADYSILKIPDGSQHRYRVFAEAFPGSQSEASDEVVTEACSF